MWKVDIEGSGKLTRSIFPGLGRRIPTMLISVFAISRDIEFTACLRAAVLGGDVEERGRCGLFGIPYSMRINLAYGIYLAYKDVMA